MKLPLVRAARISAAASASVVLALFALPNARADNTYNDTITSIFGTGNPAGGWAAQVDPTHGGLTLALRAKNRTTGSINDDGTSNYTETTGTIAGGLANWNFEFSIYDPTLGTDGITYQLGIDTDPTAGQSITWINPLSSGGGDQYGTTSTASGAGAFTFVTGDTVVQNSENIKYTGQNPNQPGDYTYYLDAYNSTGTLIDTDQINVHVAAVPDASSTLALAALSFGLLLLPAALGRFKRLGGEA